MSQLIHMRQRIKTIKTIEKITHAMRLIAISTHTRLRLKEQKLQKYHTEVELLFKLVGSFIKNLQHPFFKQKENGQQLLIIIGSQKGLCGNFNTMLVQASKKIIQDNNNNSCDIITIGKKIYETILNKVGIKPLFHFDSFKADESTIVAQKIINYIKNSEVTYQKITVISSFAKSFFNQIPQTLQLLPLSQKIITSSEEQPIFIFDQPPLELFDQLLDQYITATLSCKIFATVIAEHAARFVSMDSATRNAKNILHVTQLQYNKLRQSKITRELIELSGSLHSGM